MSITSGRSFLRPDEGVDDGLIRPPAFRRSSERGRTERSSESRDISSAGTSSLEMLLALDARLRFLELVFTAAEGLAHSGTG